MSLPLAYSISLILQWMKLLVGGLGVFITRVNVAGGGTFFIKDLKKSNRKLILNWISIKTNFVR